MCSVLLMCLRNKIEFHIQTMLQQFSVFLYLWLEGRKENFTLEIWINSMYCSICGLRQGKVPSYWKCVTKCAYETNSFSLNYNFCIRLPLIVFHSAFVEPCCFFGHFFSFRPRINSLCLLMQINITEYF